MKRTAFSLIELSIVLVILGLLVGGILAGQSLIRAAELRAVSAEYVRWQTAIAAFKDKYFALPGDMSNATGFWGTASACPGLYTQPSTTSTTCNGNGNGVIESAPAAGLGNEYFRFWQHLSNAGLVEGIYAGVQGQMSTIQSMPGFNVPASKLPGGCWSATSSINPAPGNAYVFDMPGGNKFVFGKPEAAALGSCKDPIMTPAELWNIDKKVDDGMPGRGLVTARYWNDCTLATSSADTNAAYDLSIATAVCAIETLMRW